MEAVEDIAADALSTLATGLDYLEGLLGDDREFLLGARPTMADCTLAAALQFARFGEMALDTKFRQIARWDEMYRQRGVAKSVLSL